MNDAFTLPIDDFPIDHPRANEILTFLNGKNLIRILRKSSLPPGTCYWNVSKYVSNFGGKIILGWMIDWIPQLNVEAMHHAVYQSPEGELIDITSPFGSRVGSYTTFIPSDELEINLSELTRIPRRNLHLVEDPELIRHLYLYEKNFAAHTSFLRALLKDVYATFKEGKVIQTRKVDAEFERKYKPEIEKTHKEGMIVRKKLFNKYFRKS